MASVNGDDGVKPSAILGVNVTFEIITILSVLMRLYVRFRVMKSPWWDDLMVALSIAFATLGTVSVCLATNYGLGKHMAGLSQQQFEKYIFRFYLSNGAYNMSTAFIKLSLLFQYLRIFEAGLVRKFCIFLIVIISIWGIVYSFMAWFPCFPIRAYWDWSLVNAKCYAYGTKEREPFVTAYESHSALNLVFDIIVFVMPISIFWRKERSGREYAAMLGLFTLGAMVIVVSTWRLAAIVKHQAGWVPELDFTYYAALPILLACLELDIAVLAASMPIFWPIILKVLSPIKVMKEVHITRERRWGASEVELGENTSTHSKTKLNQKEIKGSLHHCKDSYVVERIMPLDGHVANRGVGVQRESDGRARGGGGMEHSSNMNGRWGSEFTV